MTNLGNLLKILLFHGLIVNICFAQNEDFLDQKKEKNNSHLDFFGSKHEYSIGYSIRNYQTHLSSARFSSCPMFPSCSNFGLQAFEQYSFFKASVLTSDRLLRCGYDNKFYSVTDYSSNQKLADFPIETSKNNYFLYSNLINTRSFSIDSGETNFDNRHVQLLISQRNFKEALTYIYQIEFSKKNIGLELFLNKLICLRGLNRLEDVIFEYEVRCSSYLKNQPFVKLEVALTHFYLNNHEKASSLLAEVIFENHNIQNSNFVQKALALKALLYFDQHLFRESRKIYSDLEKNSYFSSSPLLPSTIFVELGTFRPKNQNLATFFSIIPGLGYAYSSHYQTALQSFLINSLLFYGTYSNFKAKNYGMGILTGLVNLSFYMGNFKGSRLSAKRFNDSFYNHKKQQLISISNLN